MRRLVEVTEEDGFEALLGQRVTFFCVNYIYTGKLVGVNDRFVALQDAAIVYETGEFTTKSWKDVQALPHPINIMLSSIEAWGEVK